MITVLVGRGRASAGGAAPLVIQTQPSSAPVNAVAFAQQPAIQISTATAGVTVTAAVVSVVVEGVPVPTGTLGGTLTAVTNGAGLATFTDLKITGLNHVQVVSFTAPSHQAAYSDPVTPTPGAATKAFIRVNPADAVSGVAFTTQPIIELQDASGNPTGTGTTNVVATKATGSGTLSGTTTLACVAGVATFTNLVITGTGNHTIDFTPTSLTVATSTTFNVASAAATALAMVTQPAGAVAATVFTTQPAVQLVVSGSPYSYAFGTVENPLSDSSKWTTPTGATALKASGGTAQASVGATVCNMYVNSTGLATVSSNHSSKVTFAAGSTGSCNVTVRDQGNGSLYYWGGGPADNVVAMFYRYTGGQQYLGSVNHTFAVGTDTMELVAEGSELRGYINDTLLLTVQHSTLTGGRPGLMLYGDAEADTYVGGSNGNTVVVLSSGVNVSVAKHAGVAGTLSGTTTVATDANGVATFTNLQMSAAESGVTLDFTSSGLTGVTSTAFQVTSGAATKIVMVTQPASAVDGVAFGQQPAVRLQDAASNNVLTASVTITVVKQTGTGTLSGTTTANTNASGIATFTNLSLANGGAGGTYTLRFSSGGLTTIDSQSFDVTASSPPSANYPNRPGNYTVVVQDYAMNTTPPTSPPNDRSMGDGSGWGITGSQVTKVTDATDPVSPSNVMQWTYLQGQGTPTDSFSPGKLYLFLDSSVTEWYIAFPVWHDANFEWNPISNKLMFLLKSGASLVFQSRYNSTYWNMIEESTDAFVYNPNVAAGGNPTGAWRKVEVIYKLGASGYYKCWIDGTLVSNFTGLSLPTGMDTIMLDGTWGGGSGPTTRTSTRRIGHIFIAHP